MGMWTGKAKYTVMACVLLHNFCITVGDPCLPRWKFQVEELTIVDKRLIREESKRESNSNKIKLIIGYGKIKRSKLWNTNFSSNESTGERGSQDAWASCKIAMYFFFRSVVSIFQTFRNNLIFVMLIIFRITRT